MFIFQSSGFAKPNEIQGKGELQRLLEAVKLAYGDLGKNGGPIDRERIRQKIAGE